MKDNLWGKILTILIILMLIIILALIMYVYKNDTNYISNSSYVSDESMVSINDYEEITIAYSILDKYISCIRNKDYNTFKQLFVNQDSITEKQIQSINNKLEEKINEAKFIIKYQGKKDDNTYFIKYYEESLGNCEMTYRIDRDNMLFYILQDSNMEISK